MDLTTLAILAGLVMVLLFVPVFGTLFIAGLAGAIFVWRKIFPLGWGIAEWITNRRNLIPFVLFMLIVIAVIIILLILSYFLIMNVLEGQGLFYFIGLLVMLLLLLILFIAETIFWGGLGLAIILWIIRLSHWAYANFRRGFWRTFRPGGPPDFQPVPVPLTNPVSVAPPSSKRNSNRGRKPLVKRRAMIPAMAPRPSKRDALAVVEKQAQVKEEAKRRRPVARRRETSPIILDPPSNEMALAGVEAKRAKVQVKEDAKQAKAQPKEDAKQAKIQAKEEAREAKRTQAMAEAEEKALAKEDKKAQAIIMSEEKTRDKEEAKKAKAEQKAQVKDQAELKEEEKEKGTPRLRRKGRLKGNKPL